MLVSEFFEYLGSGLTVPTHYANIPICFIPQVSPFYIVEKVKLGVLKMKVYFMVLTRMVKEGVVT